MSRVGKKPIEIPTGVKVEIDEAKIKISGSKGELFQKLHPAIKVNLKENLLIVSRTQESKFHKSLHGLFRALLQNLVKGVTQGFSKELEIVGIGYKAELSGKNLSLVLGFSHPILFSPPPGIKLEVLSPTRIAVSGIDKQLVGEVAAKIRSFRPPEPYKGKGIKYAGEKVRKKAGKTAV